MRLVAISLIQRGQVSEGNLFAKPYHAEKHTSSPLSCGAVVFGPLPELPACAAKRRIAAGNDLLVGKPARLIIFPIDQGRRAFDYTGQFVIAKGDARECTPQGLLTDHLGPD